MKLSFVSQMMRAATLVTGFSHIRAHDVCHFQMNELSFCAALAKANLIAEECSRMKIRKMRETRILPNRFHTVFNNRKGQNVNDDSGRMAIVTNRVMNSSRNEKTRKNHNSETTASTIHYESDKSVSGGSRHRSFRFIDFCYRI